MADVFPMGGDRAYLAPDAPHVWPEPPKDPPWNWREPRPSSRDPPFRVPSGTVRGADPWAMPTGAVPTGGADACA